MTVVRSHGNFKSLGFVLLIVVTVDKYINHVITELNTAVNATQQVRLEEAHPVPLVSMALQ